MYFELVIDLLISSFTQYQLIEVSGGAFTTHFMEFFKDSIRNTTTPLYRFPSASAPILSPQ